MFSHNLIVRFILLTETVMKGLIFMRVALHRVESDCLKLIYDNEISKEETLELVVPDVCADIGKILDVRGQFLLSSTKAKTDEVHVSASVEVTVIYAADESGKVQHVSAIIPFDQTIPVEGADENAKIILKCRLCTIDARTLNPRKLLLRADVSMHLCAYYPDNFALWDNLSDNTSAPVHILQKEIEHCLVMGIREKSFTISDEYRVSEDKGQNLKMLSASTEICVQDAKAVGNKLVLKAEANTTAVFLNENDDSLFSCVFSSQFSQIIEVDTYGESIEDTVIIQLKDAEFTCIPNKENGYAVSAQLHMTAQAVCRERKNSVYIADAYSNEYKMVAEAVDTKIAKCPILKNLKLSMRGKLQQKTTLDEIMYIAAAAVCAEADGNEIVCRAYISGVGKSESGDLESIALELKAEENIELTKSQKLNIVSICCGQPAVIGPMQNAEVGIEINIEYAIVEFSEINAVAGIELDEESNARSENCPSLVVLCSERGTDLWSLAKKYGSTVELITNSNTIDGEFSTNRRPLLIPKSK